MVITRENRYVKVVFARKDGGDSDPEVPHAITTLEGEGYCGVVLYD